MKRITRRLSGGSIEFIDGQGYASLTHAEGVKLLLERLALYEDTGLSPSDIHNVSNGSELQGMIELTRNSDSELFALSVSSITKIEPISEPQEVEGVKWYVCKIDTNGRKFYIVRESYRQIRNKIIAATASNKQKG